MTVDVIFNKYKILGKKGEGTFSEVLKCQDIEDGSHWACKKMKHRYETIEQVNRLQEVQALRRLGVHPNILQLREVLFDKKSGLVVLVCELMDMNIYELIRGRQNYLPEKKVKMYMYQLLLSLDFMHRNGIFHRDVKPENILIRDDLLKLADFGSCRGIHTQQPYTEYISTRWYRAPECLLTDGYYSHKMDIWSFGCVLYELISLRPLFPGSNEVDQIAKIHDVMGTPDPAILNKLKYKSRGMSFNFTPKAGTGIEVLLPQASDGCIDIIYKSCKYDAEERWTARDLLKHPYFREFRELERRNSQKNSLELLPKELPKEVVNNKGKKEPEKKVIKISNTINDNLEKENIIDSVNREVELDTVPENEENHVSNDIMKKVAHAWENRRAKPVLSLTGTRLNDVPRPLHAWELEKLKKAHNRALNKNGGKTYKHAQKLQPNSSPEMLTSGIALLRNNHQPTDRRHKPNASVLAALNMAYYRRGAPQASYLPSLAKSLTKVEKSQFAESNYDSYELPTLNRH